MIEIEKYINRNLLKIGSNVVMEDIKICLPDRKGNIMPSIIGDNVVIRNGSIIFAGVNIASNVVIEENVIVGHPEDGYAVGKEYTGNGLELKIEQNTTIRSGAQIYGGVTIGSYSHIGHGTIIRTNAIIGSHTFIGHNTIIERASIVGNYVRFSPLCHITSNRIIEDRVFLGAGVITINDKGMIWKHPNKEPELYPPYFEFGARIGSGCTIMAGVRIGEQAMIGAGSVVTKDIPSFMIALGSPAKIKKQRPPEDLLTKGEE